jgi:hypothetical protein
VQQREHELQGERAHGAERRPDAPEEKGIGVRRHRHALGGEADAEPSRAGGSGHSLVGAAVRIADDVDRRPGRLLELLTTAVHRLRELLVRERGE